ncbi:hypothetical protein CGLAMM_11435 [Acetobacteraceae bacterium EV16G]|uniref:hypothetical protein n=1 Tax=Sorlinia euscelidii TaxID=3081148 RepID=UPI002F3D08D9
MSTPKVLDLVLETSTNPGTGAFVLNGAPTGRRSFATALAEGGDVYYYAEDGSQAEWGVGALEVGAVNTLTRQTILGNTSAGRNPLNFTTEVRVYSGLPGDRIAPLNADGTLSLASPAEEDDSETAPTTNGHVNASTRWRPPSASWSKPSRPTAPQPTSKKPG